MLNLADGAADFDDVTDFDRTFKKEDNSGDKIIEDVLQSESDPDAECSGDDRNLCQINAKRSKGHKKSNEQDHVVKHRRNGVGNAAGKMEALINVFFQRNRKNLETRKEAQTVIRNARMRPGETFSEPMARFAFSTASAAEINGARRPKKLSVRLNQNKKANTSSRRQVLR